MDFSLFSPTARRRNRELRRRLQSQRLKAYDKFKLEQEQYEAEQLKLLQQANKDDTSDKSDTSAIESRGLYYISSEKKDSWDNEDEDSCSSEKGGSYTIKGGFFGHCCRNFFATNVKYELKWKEFFCLTFCLQMPIAYIFRHITMVRKWGSAVVLTVYLITAMTIAMPVYMVYMFLGNYSRRSYIKYWECVPLMKGMAYSIAITSIMMEVSNVSIAGLALFYIKIVLMDGVPWSDCKFPSASKDCIPISETSIVHNTTCCDQFRDKNCTRSLRLTMLAKFSTLDYYMTNVLKLGYSTQLMYEGLNWSWIAATEISWMLIFLLTLMGLRRFRGFMTTINLVIYVIFIPVGIMTLIISPQHFTSQDLDTDYGDLLNYQFWVETCVHTFHRELPGDVITFSSVSRPGISTTIDTLTVYSTKLLFIILLTVWLSITIGIVQTFYNIKSNLCILLEGDTFFFAIIPDLISRWVWPQVWLIIYFAIVFFWGFSTAVYVVNSFLEAMLEQFPSWAKWRIIISAILCASVGTGNAFLLRANYISLNTKFLESTYIQMRITLLFISILGLFLYSIDRLKGDYHFTYGTMLGTYWVSGIKIAMLLIVILSFIVYALQFSEEATDDYLVFVLSLAPIVIGMVIMTARYVLRVSKTLIAPDPKWGPPGRKKRQARNRFDPTHDLHYMSTQQRCKHDCLINSSALRKEVKYWHSKKYMFAQAVSQEEEENLNKSQ